MQQAVLEHARDCDAPDGGARGRARVHHTRLLLAGLLEEWTTVQSEIQAGEPHPRAHWRETVPLPLPRLRQGVRKIRKPQNTQKNTYR